MSPQPATAASAHGRILHSEFRPHPLLRSPHLQTIGPALLRPLPPLDLRIERLELPDGDFVDLGWAGQTPAAPTALAVLVHGLGGSFDSKYLRGLARRLVAAGWWVCALRLRGGGPERNRRPHHYHQGATGDLRHLWHLLRGRHPGAFLAGVGWSLGGNLTLKALGEEGRDAPLDVAVALSVPFSLHDCAEHLRHGFARVYQRELLDACKALVARKQDLPGMPPGVDFAKALGARDFFEFDDAWTAPVNGFADAADYYARACCTPYLSRIRVPTHLLHALDDPFMRPQTVPGAESLSPAVTLEISARGGHVGFIGADRRGRPECWSEARVERLLLDAKAERHR